MVGDVTETRRLYLHVGCPKTGTSFLQDTFWDSRATLAADGLHLPLRDSNDHFLVALATRGELDADRDPTEAYDVLDRLVAELREVSAARVLLSHELLASVTADQAAKLRALLSDFDLHIVLTVRDLQRQIPAAWQQQVKQRSVVPFERFLTAVVEDDAETAYFWDRQDIAGVAERWRGDLPAERVHLVTVPPPGADPDVLLRRFCHVLEVDPSTLNGNDARLNESLGVAQAELLRRVNVALGDRLPHRRAGYSRIVRCHFARTVLAAQAGRHPELPAELHEWCRDRSEQMVRQLEGAGYHVVGDLDELLPVGSAPEPSELGVADADLLASAVEALADLLYQRHRDVQRLCQLRTRTNYEHGA